MLAKDTLKTASALSPRQRQITHCFCFVSCSFARQSASIRTRDKALLEKKGNKIIFTC
jgi:hypothetical protein